MEKWNLKVIYFVAKNVEIHVNFSILNIVHELSEGASCQQENHDYP